MMSRSCAIFKTIIGMLAGLMVAPLCLADLSQEQIDFFEAKIRPVLIDSCYECHSQEDGVSKGGLTLDSRYGLRQGGNTGPGVVPGDLEESWLWLAISHSEPDYEMPPKSKLPDEVLADFRTWIEMGAPDPREGEADVISEIDIEAGKQHWAFQRPVAAAAPTVADGEWPRNDVDRYILAELEEQGLQPVADAPARAMVRRLSYDLVGLPPTADFARTFHRLWQQDGPERAIEAAIDKLMRSRQYGERWGRHWLDVARYAESNGKGSNQAYPHAWRYRDYVIDSINADKSWQRMIREQLAGDLLPAANDRQRQEQLIATGFLALGAKDFRQKNSRQFLMDLVDEQIDATSQAFLGLTVSCARCHDHKFDPIPTVDYYAMAGVFQSTYTYYGTSGSGHRYNVGELIELPIATQPNVAYTEADIAKLRAELEQVNEDLRLFHEDKKEKMRNGGVSDDDKRGSARRLRTTQSRLEEELAAIDGTGGRISQAMGVLDRDSMVEAAVLVRGEIDSPAQSVPRGFLQVLQDRPVAVPEDHSGRLEMAGWISSDKNPLTARVLVNRFWQKLFGRGLVYTTENFGTTGQAASHPELLDYLALRFVEGGWQLKPLLKEIMLSRTYQLATTYSEAAYAVDPDNTYLWRSAPRRLDAEALRDSILAVSGQLDYQRPYGSVVSDYGDGELGRRSSPDLVTDFPSIRSVYLPPIRDAMPELIDLFDGADPGIVTGARVLSNGPEQSLFMMNDRFVLAQAEHFAQLLETSYEQVDDQIRAGFLRAYGRPPTPAEQQGAETLLRSQPDRFLRLFCQGLLASAEFRYL